MKKKILVSPLNWGLGHATRSIPVIQRLLDRGCEVILASDGIALNLLEKEFPELERITLPSYNITYHTGNAVSAVVRQLPAVFLAIRKEHKALKRIVNEHQISGIISDSRFGLYHKFIPSVIISHQIHLKVSFSRILERLVTFGNVRALKRFDFCWVPDEEGEKNISGAYSHPKAFSSQRFVGILSRLKTVEAKKQYDIMVVLSGPEPERSILEDILIKQLLELKEKMVLIVQGKADVESSITLSDNVKLVSYLKQNELNVAIQESEVIICRSGYSGLMDLAVLGKKALLIPTPGQPEQEYLAQQYQKKGFAPFQKQDEIDIEKGLLALESFKGLKLEGNTQMLDEAISEFLKRC